MICLYYLYISTNQLLVIFPSVASVSGVDVFFVVLCNAKVCGYAFDGPFCFTSRLKKTPCRRLRLKPDILTRLDHMVSPDKHSL